MGKKKMSPPKRLTAKVSKKGARAKHQPVIRNCAKCLERHKAPTDKKCLRLQTPGLQVGAEPLPGPPGLYLPSSSAESVSADEIRLTAALFAAASSTDESTPPRNREVTLRTVSYDERQPEVRSLPSSREDEMTGYDEVFEDEYEEVEEADNEARLYSASSQDGESTDEVSPLQTFNRMASQLLDRMERSEQKSAQLEQQLALREAELLKEKQGNAGYEPPRATVQTRHDRETAHNAFVCILFIAFTGHLYRDFQKCKRVQEGGIPVRACPCS